MYLQDPSQERRVKASSVLVPTGCSASAVDTHEFEQKKIQPASNSAPPASDVPRCRVLNTSEQSIPSKYRDNIVNNGWRGRWVELFAAQAQIRAITTVVLEHPFYRVLKVFRDLSLQLSSVFEPGSGDGRGGAPLTPD